MRVFLDTNIFLVILNQEKNWQLAEELLSDINKGKHMAYTSVICISEILSGFYEEDESEKGEMFITDLKAISNFIITDVDFIISKEAAKMRAKYKIKLPDAVLASSCKIHRCNLITQDKDLKKIKEINVKSIDEI